MARYYGSPVIELSRKTAEGLSNVLKRPKLQPGVKRTIHRALDGELLSLAEAWQLRQLARVPALAGGMQKALVAVAEVSEQTSRDLEAERAEARKPSVHSRRRIEKDLKSVLGAAYSRSMRTPR